MKKVFKLAANYSAKGNLATADSNINESEHSSEIPSISDNPSNSETTPSEEQVHAAQMLKINLLVVKYSDIPESQIKAKKDILELYQKLSPSQKIFLTQNEPAITEILEEKNRLSEQIKAKNVIKKSLTDEQQLAYANCCLDFLTAKQSYDSGSSKQNQTYIAAIEAFSSNLKLIPPEQQQKLINELLTKRWDSLIDQISEAKNEKISHTRKEYAFLIKQRLDELSAFSNSILLACALPDSSTLAQLRAEYASKFLQIQNSLDPL